MSLLTLSNSQPLRGDLLKSAVLRYDAVPVPATLEAVIRADADTQALLAEGKTVECNGDTFRIVKAEYATERLSQGTRDMGAVKIIALLDACHPIVFVKPKGIIKERTTLADVYRACGASLQAIDADFQVPRFVCLAGGVPSFAIAHLLQEEGGIVRWKDRRLKFFRLADLFTQKPALQIPDNASENVTSGFKERHEVPFFYSVAQDGKLIYGNRAKSRTSRYVPNKDERQLRNMGRYLLRRKVSKIAYNASLAAGDLVGISASDPLAVVTAVHVFQSGTDGSGANQYTRLFLASLEE